MPNDYSKHNLDFFKYFIGFRKLSNISIKTIREKICKKKKIFQSRGMTILRTYGDETRIVRQITISRFQISQSHPQKTLKIQIISLEKFKEKSWNIQWNPNKF